MPMMPSSRKTLKVLSRIHFLVLAFSFLGYLALSFILGPRFLATDVLNKLRVLADELIVVTAVVLGPPETPVVTATPTCVSASPRIVLDWANDAATTTWDIDRDGSTLVTGLTASTYTDTAVLGNGTYSYTVTAYGPMSPGVAVSTVVTATAIDCASLLPPASLTLSHLGSTNVTPPRTLPIRISGTQPRIKGNTNVVSAWVDITVTRPLTIVRIAANTNGYFVWKPPRSLRSGEHTLTVTVTDPNDSSRTTSETLEFFTKEESSQASSEKKSLRESESGSSAVTQDQEPATFDFTIANTLEADSVLSVTQGERMIFFLKSKEGAIPEGTVFEPMLMNARGDIVFRAPTQTVTTDITENTEWSLEIPLYLPAGSYTFVLEGWIQGVSVSRSFPVTVKTKPLLQVGEHTVVSYEEAGSVIGWVFFTSLTVSTGILLLFIREFGLSLRGARQVTERELRRIGMIPWRKGVGKR